MGTIHIVNAIKGQSVFSILDHISVLSESRYFARDEKNKRDVECLDLIMRYIQGTNFNEGTRQQIVAELQLSPICRTNHYHF